MIDEYQASGIHDSFRRRRKTDTPFMTGKNKKEPVQSPLFSQSIVDKKVKPTKKNVVDPSDESEGDLRRTKLLPLLPMNTIWWIKVLPFIPMNTIRPIKVMPLNRLSQAMTVTIQLRRKDNSRLYQVMTTSMK
jgi:hypothetical protein